MLTCLTHPLHRERLSGRIRRHRHGGSNLVDGLPFRVRAQALAAEEAKSLLREAAAIARRVRRRRPARRMELEWAAEFGTILGHQRRSTMGLREAVTQPAQETGPPRAAPENGTGRSRIHFYAEPPYGATQRHRLLCV